MLHRTGDSPGWKMPAPFCRQQLCWAPCKPSTKMGCSDRSSTRQVISWWTGATGSQEKREQNFPSLSTWKPENFQTFWMKGGFKHLPSEETSRIKTLLEHLSFLLSNSLKSTGSIVLPLVSIGSSHRCQQKPSQEQNCLCWCSLPASHKKKIKEKYRELSEGKIILNLHLGKAQSFVFITTLPR